MECTVARAHRSAGSAPGGSEPPRSEMVVGLHETQRYDSVLDIEGCLLQSDRMNGLLAEARSFFAERGLTVYEQDTGEGLLRFLMLREGRQTGELMTNVVTSAPAVSELAPLAQRRHPPDAAPTSVGTTGNPKKPPAPSALAPH